MASRIWLGCINPNCKFGVVLWQDVPVWREETPPELAKLPVGTKNREYVEHSMSEGYCVRCERPAVAQEGIATCSEAGCKTRLIGEEDLCPACKEGVLARTNMIRF